MRADKTIWYEIPTGVCALFAGTEVLFDVLIADGDCETRLVKFATTVATLFELDTLLDETGAVVDNTIKAKVVLKVVIWVVVVVDKERTGAEEARLSYCGIWKARLLDAAAGGGMLYMLVATTAAELMA